MKKIVLFVVIVAVVLGSFFIIKSYNKKKYSYNKETYEFKSEKEKKIIKKRYLDDKKSEYEKRVAIAKKEEGERRKKREEFLKNRPIRQESKEDKMLREKLVENDLDMKNDIIILGELYGIEKDNIKKEKILSVMISYYKDIIKIDGDFNGKLGTIDELNYYRDKFIEKSINRRGEKNEK